MGGLNSGSCRRSDKLRSDELHRIGIADVRRAFGAAAFASQIRALGSSACGIVIRTNAEGGYVVQICRQVEPGDVPRGITATLPSPSPGLFVALVVTHPNFGGVRYWFRCSKCTRRCAVVYREPRADARAFGCRQCIRFRYVTQVLSPSDLILGRIERLLLRLELRPGGTVAKPKGMHQATFQTLVTTLDAQSERWRRTSPLSRHFGRILSKAERLATRAGAAAYGGGRSFAPQPNDRRQC
jgi:hypothetical protein